MTSGRRDGFDPPRSKMPTDVAAFGVSQAIFEIVVMGLGLVAFGTVVYFGHITESC